MNADEARAITKRVRKSSVDVSVAVGFLEAMVRRSAERGDYRIEPWQCLMDAGLGRPSEYEKQAIKDQLYSQGFKWTDEPPRRFFLSWQFPPTG